MRIVLAHSHANTFGGGERAVLELGRALMSRHDVRLLLGRFDVRQTYPELAGLPHRRFGGAQWLTSDVNADAIIANSFGANLLALRNGRRHRPGESRSAAGDWRPKAASSPARTIQWNRFRGF